MSKDAVVYFSGGKDSVMSVWKARQLGYNVVAGIHFRSASKLMAQDTDLVEAVAERVGITDIRYDTYYSSEEVSDTMNPDAALRNYTTAKERDDEIYLGLKADYPNLKYVIYCIDDVQPTEAHYMRKAHHYGLTAVNPYNGFYGKEFFADCIDNNVELKMQFPKESLILSFYINGKPMSEAQKQLVIDEISYECGDIIDLNDMMNSYNVGNNMSLYSMSQTMVTNADFFSSSVPTHVVDGRLSLLT